MWIDFILGNFHFVLSIFIALVFFAVFWLHLDAWMLRHDRKEAVKFCGFLLLSLSFLIHATFIESNLLPGSFGGGWLNDLATLFRLAGYFMVIAGQILDPLQKRPDPSDFAVKPASGGFLFFPFHLTVMAVTFPVLALASGLLYLRRATTGLERHLRPVALSFFFVALSELLALASFWRGSDSVNLFNLVKPYGPVWLLEHALLLTGGVILGKWVVKYLFKRLQTQLFMIFNVVILGVFLITTISFTFLLLRNLETESLGQLGANVKALNLAVESKQEDSLSDAVVIAQNSQVIGALEKVDRDFLASFAESFLLSKKQSQLTILNEDGQVLARGEDKERIGDSLSEDTLIQRALLGEESSSMLTKNGVLTPEIYVRSATPVKKGEVVIGVVVTGTILDNAFVDGLKKATGLEVSIFGANILSATTLLSSDTRPVGTKEENQVVKDTVLKNGEAYTGSAEIQNTLYLASYLPLKDVDDQPIGMMFVGRPQSNVLQAASRSIELTFLTTVVLLVLSVLPAFLVARSLSNQLK